MKYIHNFGQNKSSSCENSIVFSFDYNKCWAACWPILFHSSIKFLHKRLVLIFKSSNWSFSFAYFLRKNKLPESVWFLFWYILNSKNTASIFVLLTVIETRFVLQKKYLSLFATVFVQNFERYFKTSVKRETKLA